MNAQNVETAEIEFNKVYSYPGDMESVVSEYYSIFEKVEIFLLPLKINIYESLGWVLIEFLNNAIRSPISIAMNMGVTDLNEIDFFTDIIVRKTISSDISGDGADIEISVMNRGKYAEIVFNSMQSILNGELTVIECEERFMLKGSYTGNGGMGILLSKKQVENSLGGTLTLNWKDGFYNFTIRFRENDVYKT